MRLESPISSGFTFKAVIFVVNFANKIELDYVHTYSTFLLETSTAPLLNFFRLPSCRKNSHFDVKDLKFLIQ